MRQLTKDKPARSIFFLKDTHHTHTHPISKHLVLYVKKMHITERVRDRAREGDRLRG